MTGQSSGRRGSFLESGKTEQKDSKAGGGARNTETEVEHAACAKMHRKGRQKLLLYHFSCGKHSEKQKAFVGWCISLSEYGTMKHVFVSNVTLYHQASASTINWNKWQALSHCNSVQTFHFFLPSFLPQSNEVESVVLRKRWPFSSLFHRPVQRRTERETWNRKTLNSHKLLAQISFTTVPQTNRNPYVSTTMPWALYKVTNAANFP